VNLSSASNCSDSELLERYSKGHRNEWLGILLDRYLHLIFGVCMKYLKNEEDAKDHTQQICLEVIKTLPRHQVTYFKSWLYKVARNHCLMHLRAAHVRVVPLASDQVAEGRENETDAPLRESRLQNLEQALQSLNAHQRRCVELFYLQKKTYQRISEETGYTLQQVKSHIQNGKRNLRLMLERMQAEGGEGGEK
jgi:RNA polymerase sigma-70 factor (ECF subfamily)